MKKPAPLTNNERQAKRREREKEWLTAHGYNSWEQIHTKLMNGEILLDWVTPAYSKRNYFDYFNGLKDTMQKVSPTKKKKGKQS